MKDDEVVEAQKIMTEAEIRQKQIPPFNSEFCLANGIDQNVINRFWEKIVFPENLVDLCWYWNAAKIKKYGIFNFAGSTYRAHRFSYMMFKGAIREGLEIRHTCNNPSCVNPFHLLDGTHQDNMDDKVNQNRQAKGEDVWMAKLTELEVKEILCKLIEGVTGPELANQYNVSETPISQIANGETWKDLYNLLTEEQKQKIKDNRINNRKQTKVESEAVWTAKLTEILVDEILHKLLQKISRKELVLQYDVSVTTIYNISIGNTWKESYNKLSKSQQQQLRYNVKQIKKLSPENNEEIRELNKNGMTQVDLAVKFNVSQPVISNVIRKVYPYDY